MGELDTMAAVVEPLRRAAAFGQLDGLDPGQPSVGG